MDLLRTPNKDRLSGLRQRWVLFAIVCLLILAGGFIFLSNSLGVVAAVRWLITPVLITIYLLTVLWRNLGANHRAGESQLLPGFGWGNILTLARGILIAAMMGFLFLSRPEGWLIWIPGILYILADAADFFDGYLARVTNHETRLGEILDMRFDGLGVLTASLLAVKYSQVPDWYILVGSARFLYMGGLWLRKRLNKPIYELPPSISRRVFAGFLMGFLAVILLPLFSPPGTKIAASLFGIPFLVGFTWDFLTISGVVQPIKDNFSQFTQIAKRWLPVVLRLVILGLYTAWMSKAIQNINFGDPAIVLLGLSYSALVFLIVLGAAPRIAAGLALATLGVYQMFASLTAIQIVLAAAYIILLYMGSGALSLWTPEEGLIHSRAGERGALGAEN